MALSTSFVGSGEFVQETEWSCPYHDRYANPIWGDEGDGEIECLDCEASGWRKLWNEDGSPKMRELSTWEVWMRADAKRWAEEWNRSAKLWDEILSRPKDGKQPIIKWREDDLG